MPMWQSIPDLSCGYVLVFLKPCNCWSFEEHQLICQSIFTQWATWHKLAHNDCWLEHPTAATSWKRQRQLHRCTTMSLCHSDICRCPYYLSWDSPFVVLAESLSDGSGMLSGQPLRVGSGHCVPVVSNRWWTPLSTCVLWQSLKVICNLYDAVYWFDNFRRMNEKSWNYQAV